MNLGNVLAERGNLANAEQRYAEGIAIQQDKSNKAATLVSLGDLLVLQGKLPEAEERYRQAQSFQDESSTAGSKIGLAAILLAKGAAPQAEAAIRTVLKELPKGEAEAAAQARLVLVQSLLAQKKPEDAKRELAALNALAGATSARSLRYGAQIVSARVQGAAGVESLRKVAREANLAGMPGIELEARLAIGETELADGKTAIARKELENVQREAAARGYKLIEQKAAAASGG